MKIENKVITLEVLVATLGREGLERTAAMLPPPQPGVTYLVAWQKAEGEIPQALDRPDVKVRRNPGMGLSQNRNYALDRATGDVLLIADDDLGYRHGAFRQIISKFELHESLDVATFRLDGLMGKTYPATETDLGRGLPRGYYVSSCEVAMRRATAGVRRFEEKLGLGAPYCQCGEEEAWMHGVRKVGMVCRYFPLVIATHPRPTTGQRRATMGTLHGFGAALSIMHPWTWPARVALKAWRLRRQGQASLWPALWHQLCGAVYALRRIRTGS